MEISVEGNIKLKQYVTRINVCKYQWNTTSTWKSILTQIL